MRIVETCSATRSTFADAIPTAGLASLAQESRRLLLSAGECLIRQGDRSDSLYVVLRGRVQVERVAPGDKHPTVLAALGPGEVVGEVGAVRGTPRTAAVVAIEPTEALEVDLSALAMLALGFPDVVDQLQRTMRARQRANRELLRSHD